ncbi:MAG: DUF502 domain-containing protein [Betaproteobacteria bacterium]|nr:MAG: DUF502 domain-containing protein [Betaproteobacteria bacterium]
MKKYLITGLLIWIPLVITLWVLKLVVDTLDQTLLLLPYTLRTENWIGFHVPGMGVLLTLLIVILTGAVTANFVGQRLVHWWHEILHRIPVVRSIYSSVKQVSDTLFSSSGEAFRKALLVQWPREGMWTIAFLTGAPSGDVARHLQGDHVSVYVPTTPNPTGGYFVIVPRKDVIELEMSVDTALTYVISMGVAVPNGNGRRK